jgi:hypothetical protein
MASVHRAAAPLARRNGRVPRVRARLPRARGPPTGRRFQFSTRQIAQALIGIGRGQSDARVGETLRQESGRFDYPKTLSGRRRGWNDGSTIRDWLELFVEPIYQTRRPKRWPRIVAFDEIPFRIGIDWESDHRAGRSVFHVFGCYGWDAIDEPGQVVALRAMPRFEFNQGYAYWVEYLRALNEQLEGQPWQIVVDNDRELIRAIHLVWPPGEKDSPVVIVCHWHLKNQLLRRLLQDPRRLYRPAPRASPALPRPQVRLRLLQPRRLLAPHAANLLLHVTHVYVSYALQ